MVIPEPLSKISGMLVTLELGCTCTVGMSQIVL